MKIIKIIEVKDTRDYMEEGDRWVPIPGSGRVRHCDRCDRMHEVHALVELEDHTFATVGTGCMKGDEFEKELKNSASRARTTRRLQCELDAARKEYEAVKAIHAEVDALEVPVVERTTRTIERGARKGQEVPEIRVGDAGAFHYWAGVAGQYMDEKELIERATWTWRENRISERMKGTGLHSRTWLHSKIQDLERRLRLR